jgi:hypothetical protein
MGRVRGLALSSPDSPSFAWKGTLMRTYAFQVKFVTGKLEIVMAFNEEEAIILAQAKQIQKGYAWKNIVEIHIID